MMRALPLSLLLVASAARAELPVLEDVLSARTIAMGGAFRAVPSSSDAPDGNPATMALAKLYQLSADGSWDAALKNWWVGTVVRDSSSSPVAGGLSYHYISAGRGGARESSSLSTLALGLPLFDGLSAGVNGRYLIRSGADAANAITMGAGLALKLGDVVSLSASGDNLIDTHHPELARFYSLAAALETGVFNAALDARSSFGPKGLYPTINAGLEVVLGGVVAARGGYTIETDARRQFLSFGAGVTVEGASMDLSYRQELTGPSRLLVLSVRTAL